MVVLSQNFPPRIYAPLNDIISLQDILTEAKTGDIIFTSGNSFGEKGIRWCTNCPFSHVAMIIREEGIQYLWEADLGQGSKRGPRVIKLVDKLHRYSGFKIGVWKKLRCKRPLTSDVLKCVEKFKNLEFDDLLLTWFVTYFYPLYRTVKRDEHVFCSELIVMTMQELGMMGKDIVPASIIPADFLHSRVGVEFYPAKYFKF